MIIVIFITITIITFVIAKNTNKEDNKSLHNFLYALGVVSTILSIIVSLIEINEHFFSPKDPSSTTNTINDSPSPTDTIINNSPLSTNSIINTSPTIPKGDSITNFNVQNVIGSNFILHDYISKDLKDNTGKSLYPGIEFFTKIRPSDIKGNGSIQIEKTIIYTFEKKYSKFVGNIYFKNNSNNTTYINLNIFVGERDESDFYFNNHITLNNKINLSLDNENKIRISCSFSCLPSFENESMDASLLIANSYFIYKTK